MTKLQFRVLYHDFLFRMVDLELLSADALGDTNKLFGQFAALLIFFSTIPGLGGLVGFNHHLKPEARLAASWSMELFLIATNMLVVGIFAVLSWDSTFPDRRDVLVLAPLPVRARTLFLAKVAASATALSVTVAALNSCSGLTWPLSLMPGGILTLPRTYAAYWITMLASGAFLYGCVLGVQGVAAQLLPRRQFLRVSGLLQTASFSLFLCGYFVQPVPPNPLALAAPQNQNLLAWQPAYWFLGLFQQLNGSMHPAMAPLAHRAWLGLAVAALGAGTAFAFSYFRTLRKIVEEPDIVPGARGAGWLPRVGNSLDTAVLHFSIRTLLRSRQHRMILSFYLGVGFALVILLGRSPRIHQEALAATVAIPGAPALFSSLVMLCFWIIGARVVYAMPLALRANWIFRVMPIRGAVACQAASRRSLVVLAVAPVWLGTAVLFFLAHWSWQPVAAHLALLGLLGIILADVCLRGFQKIPFTCSYLPGKSRIHLVVLGGIALIQILFQGAQFERRGLENPASFARVLIPLLIVAVLLRWRRAAGADLQFEEEEAPAILSLDLLKHGVTAK